MENKNLSTWLNMIDRPAFCAKNGFVFAVNSAAEKYMIHTGTDIQEIVTKNRDVYDAFDCGELFLTITVGESSYNAHITRTDEYDIFTIQQTDEDLQLQALALAAQQLRIPLSNAMLLSDKILSNINTDDSNTQLQIGQIHRSMYRMLRIITNMSDANSYKNTTREEMKTINFTAVFDEIIEKVQTISKSTGKELLYSGPDSAIYGLANEIKLGRAIYNLLSNALKFSPDGSTIEAKLTTNQNKLSFSVLNQSIDPTNNSGFQSRYSRKPAIEDDRFGLGLGMTLVCAVACAHGGTVLLDHPEGNQTRITMTIAITKDASGVVRTPVFRIGDYTGEQDNGLLELSEILPADLYTDI